MCKTLQLNVKYRVQTAVIAEQRHKHILREIERNASVSIADMEKQLNVTRETLRRDIASLDHRNLLRQVRGGAVAVDRAETSVEVRTNINLAGKAKIGRLAAELIPDNATVVIDSGTSTQAVAKHLVAKAGLTVFTNDILIAMQLLKTAHEVHLIGGLLGRDEHSTQGHDAVEMLQRYPVDFALIGVGGLHATHGFTDFSRDAAKLRDTMIEAAGVSIMLADQTKFGKIASIQLRNAVRANCLVSDSRPDEAITHYLDKCNITLIYGD